MPSFEQRAWLTLVSMCPPYIVYFVIQAGFPGLLTTMRAHIACLTVVATVHALVYVTGLMILRHREQDTDRQADERDRAVDARATRVAYFMLLGGMLLVGVVMPFGHHGWSLVNPALFFVVLSEALRSVLIVIGYRRPRFAH